MSSQILLVNINFFPIHPWGIIVINQYFSAWGDVWKDIGISQVYRLFISAAVLSCWSQADSLSIIDFDDDLYSSTLFALSDSKPVKDKDTLLIFE